MYILVTVTERAVLLQAEGDSIAELTFRALQRGCDHAAKRIAASAGKLDDCSVFSLDECKNAQDPACVGDYVMKVGKTF